jgi:beta-N-acetylhexosaminidase
MRRLWSCRATAVSTLVALTATSCAGGEQGIYSPATTPVSAPTTTSAPVILPAQPVRTSTKPQPAPPPSTPPSTQATTQAPQAPGAACTALSGRELVAQLVMVGLRGNQVDTAASRVLTDLGVGGVIVMTDPLDGGKVVRMKQASAIPLLIASDEEGGTVQRLGRFGRLASARQQARTTVAAVQASVTTYAQKVRSWGYDVAFGPVVDVKPTGGDGPMASRTFSSDPAVVTSFGEATLVGWQQAGVLPVLKHFPGHGPATGDTHLTGATVPPLAEMASRDLIPFVQLGNRGAGVMVGHLTISGSPSGLPASLDSTAYAFLRENGHGGALVFTDALDMKAVTVHADVATASVLAVIAGADVALSATPVHARTTVDRLADALASGELTEARARDAASRVLMAKGLTLCPAPPVDGE